MANVLFSFTLMQINLTSAHLCTSHSIILYILQMFEVSKICFHKKTTTT